MSELDCTRCGACCVNPSENVAEGTPYYVEIEPGDGILRQTSLRRLIVLDDEDRPHLRLAPDGRCLALSGRVGGRVRCTIYHHRPSPCRRVQAGSALCLRYRADRGL